MAGIIKETQREFSLNLKAGVIQQFSLFDGTNPNVIQMHNYSTTDTVYLSSKGNVSPSYYDIAIVPGAVGVLTSPKNISQIYLYSVSACLVEFKSYEARDITSSDLDKTQTNVIINSTTSSSVLVTSLPATPAGTNVIGKVGFDSTTPLPAGTNTIGKVSIDTLPVLPAGANHIGEVAVNVLPVIPAGANHIGEVAVNVLPSIPAGGNNIGKVDVNISPAVATNIPTIYNVTMTTANTEYSQALPAGTKKVIFSVQGGLNANQFRYAYVTGKVATPVAPYKVYNQDIEVGIDNILLTGATLYFASTLAGAIMQIECWS